MLTESYFMAHMMNLIPITLIKIMVGSLKGNFHLTTRHTKLELLRCPGQSHDLKPIAWGSWKPRNRKLSTVNPRSINKEKSRRNKFSFCTFVK